MEHLECGQQPHIHGRGGILPVCRVPGVRRCEGRPPFVPRWLCQRQGPFLQLAILLSHSEVSLSCPITLC